MPYQLVNAALMRQDMNLDDSMMESWSAPDGWPLRRIQIAAEGTRRGSLLFLGGRADHIEKYDEALTGWAAQGWDVESVDWRGQGGSARLIAGSALGHADDFADWLEDIEVYGRDWRARTQGPHVIVAHSMGGHLVLRALAEARLSADAVALSAPMLGIHTGVLPHCFAVRITTAACALGAERKAVWPSHRRTPGVKDVIQTSLTHSKVRFEREAQFELDRPDIVLDAPTWGWLRAAYRSLAAIDLPGYLERVATPLLILASKGDKVVSTQAIVRMTERLPDARLHLYGTNVAHEILREVDAVRDDALLRIDQFFAERAPI